MIASPLGAGAVDLSQPKIALVADTQLHQILGDGTMFQAAILFYLLDEECKGSFESAVATAVDAGRAFRDTVNNLSEVKQAIADAGGAPVPPSENGDAGAED